MTRISTRFRVGKWLADRRPAFIGGVLCRLIYPGRQVLETQRGVFWSDPVNYLGIDLVRHGVFEPGLIEIIEEFLTSDGVFYDIGANEGYFSVISALHCAGARIIAIEPQHRLRRVIERNLALNDVTHRVELLEVAVGDRSGDANMYLSPGVNSGSSGMTRMTRYPLRRASVKIDTLERIFDAHDCASVDLVKMDIEGHEWEAIMGSPAVFEQKRIRCLALEIHPQVLEKNGRSGDKIIGFLSDCGYRRVRGAHTVFTI